MMLHRTKVFICRALMCTKNDFLAYVILSSLRSNECWHVHVARMTFDKSDSSAVVNKYIWDTLFEMTPPFWRDRWFFDDTTEVRDAPRFLTGIKIYGCLCNITNVFSKATTRRRVNANDVEWKKRSTFQFPVLEGITIASKLECGARQEDVCNNVVGNLLNIDRKPK